MPYLDKQLADSQDVLEAGRSIRDASDHTEPVATTTIASPIGPLTLTWQSGALTGLSMMGQAHMPRQSAPLVADEAPFRAVTAQLDAYFAGKLTNFDVPMRLVGTPFQQAVWAALSAIPYGETRSYAQIASAIGKPGAARAVGLANGRNPVALIVPCHRVIAADGTIGGYGGGLDRKRFLLGLEVAAVSGNTGPWHAASGVLV